MSETEKYIAENMRRDVGENPDSYISVAVSDVNGTAAAMRRTEERMIRPKA